MAVIERAKKSGLISGRVLHRNCAVQVQEISRCKSQSLSKTPVAVSRSRKLAKRKKNDLGVKQESQLWGRRRDKEDCLELCNYVFLMSCGDKGR